MNPTNHGLLHAPLDEKDWVFGSQLSASGEMEVLDGQWLPWLPNEEDQYKFGFETNACTSFGTESCIQIILRKKFGIPWDGSEMFIAKGSGTNPQNGNTPQAVAEFIRKKGIVPWTHYPFDDTVNTLEKFYAPLPQKLYTLAITFLAEFSFT